MTTAANIATIAPDIARYRDDSGRYGDGSGPCRDSGLPAVGSTAQRVCLAGDSAGGNLCVTVALRAAAMGVQRPDGIMAAYPVTLVQAAASPSRLLTLLDPLLPLGVLLKCLSAYTGGGRRVGLCGALMGLCGAVMGLYGAVLGLYGAPMGPYGSLWVSMGQLWGSYGSLWVAMGLYGSL